ncbi:hypothetical protein PUR59_00475 [Streptomyces sp. SP18ES09]|uniref:hypothetical protein n=1 Tax=Streptomyces sp. SP18ES09 TaxID=3002532 RepID=UPI002E761ABB|nr:hypothetical protein [Streptomyces sp. SP18ES09]MEE1813526.1 hypothetical protein [Streptomyces sp. SP18ES09]
MTAPAVEAATVVPQRRLIAAGKKVGAGRIAWSYPMSQADIDAHAASSYVRQRPVALSDEERKELSDKVREINKRSSGK